MNTKTQTKRRKPRRRVIETALPTEDITRRDFARMEAAARHALERNARKIGGAR